MRKKLKKLSALFLVVVIIFSASAIVSPAADLEENKYNLFGYTVNNNEVTITSCSTLASGDIVIPDTIENLPVTAIGIGAFANCSNITGITIPDSVTAIGGGAFAYCSELTDISIPYGVTEINGGYYVLPDEYTGNINGFSIPGAFYYCTSLENVIIPDSVTLIGDRSFLNCTSLKNITIPDSVTSIGEQSFSNCTSLENIIIPDGITLIGDRSFTYCTSLENVIIPDSVTLIDNYAFYKCTSIKEIIIPDSVTSIGEYAFFNCESLDNIIIPESVENIGNNAFGIRIYAEGYSGSSEEPLTKVITIIGAKGSVAEDYADATDNIEFIDISEYETTTEPATKLPESDENSSIEEISKPSYSEKESVEIILTPDSNITVGKWSIIVNSEMKAENIADSVKNTDVEIFDSNREALSDDSYIGTGCIIRVYDGAEYSDYTIIVMCDIDGDGKISVADARLTLRAAANLDIFNEYQHVAGDVDGNKILTASDARKLLRKAVGLE